VPRRSTAKPLKIHQTRDN